MFSYATTFVFFAFCWKSSQHYKLIDDDDDDDEDDDSDDADDDVGGSGPGCRSSRGLIQPGDRRMFSGDQPRRAG